MDILAERYPETQQQLQAITPRDYQVAAITASLDGWAEGLRRILLALPTGAGKTVIFALIIRHFLAQGGRVLVVAHRDELIDQAGAKLRDVLGPDADIGVVKAERDEVNARIVVASVQTLARAHRLERLGGGFVLVVIDEAHHAPAGSYQRILDHFGCFDHDGPLLLGVTATPNRADKVGLDGTFEKIVFELNILDLITAGHLVDLTAKQVGLEADFDALRTQSGDFVDSETGAMLLKVDAPKTIAEAYQEHASDRRGIVFTPTINVAHATADAFENAGIPAAALDGGTPNDERRGILQGLRSGEIQVVTNCGVLTEGTDLPCVSAIVVAKPTKNHGPYMQMIGRGTRPYPGKRDCLILDTVGATTRLDLMTAANLFGLPASALKDKTVSEAIAAQQDADVPPVVNGRVVAQMVTLFRDRPVNWVPTKTGRFVLPTASGSVVLRPQFGDRWDVLHIPSGSSPTTLASRLTLGYAQGLAEDQARLLGGRVLIDRNAAWRRRPPSDKQLSLLRYLGIPTKRISTCGEASDAISAAKAAEVA